MEGKPRAVLERPGRLLEHLVETSVWLVLLAIIFGVQLLPIEIIPIEDAYRIAGAIIAFALFYYYIVWKYFRPEQRRFLKDVTDVVFIGLILLIAKEYSIYFFTLLFLPVAAAAFTLDLLHSLLIATFAAVFIALEIILSGQGLIDETSLLISGSQIFIFLVVTVFVRFLALQVRHEREAKDKARAEAERLAHDLAEERKLENMEKEFVNLASHQLFTPLSIIRGFASILTETPGPMTKAQQGYVADIYDNSRRMVRLLDNLRLEAKVSQHRFPIEPKRQDLAPLLRTLITEFRVRAHRRSIRLALHLPSRRVLAVFDSDATRQILWNLLDNAFHYTNHGGSVSLAGSRDGDRVTIRVTDSGASIATADQRHLFERFYRGQQAMAMNPEGTGLGLAIAKELAERQGSRLMFVSTQGTGSTFTLELPSA